MGVLQATFFIVGTCIGAGFISGAELVRFFRGELFVLPVLLSCAVFAGLLYLFLRLGRKYGGYEGTLKKLFKKAAPYVKTAVFLCAFIPCAGMLAGLDAVLPEYAPLLSLFGLAVATVFLMRGVKGISALNFVLVPLLLLFVFVYAGGDKSSFYPALPNEWGGIRGGVVYAGMNAFLAAPVLMDAGKDMKKILPPSLCSAGLIAVSALCILGKIYREGAGAVGAEMPFLYVMRGKWVFSVAVVCSILTSLVSSLYPLFCACERLKGRKKTAAKGMVLLAAFLLSRFGLSGIVGYFYPALGVAGLALSIFCIFNEYFFQKYHQKVHTRSKQTKNKRCAHHKVKFKHLPAIDDKIPESRLRNDIFAHNRTDPRHSHVHFQHGDKGRER